LTWNCVCHSGWSRGRSTDESTLQQVLAERGHLARIEHDCPGILHQQERALEKLRIGQADDDVLRIGAGGLLRHARARELGQADAEIDIGSRVIRVPPALLAAVAAEHRAAEREAALEAVRIGEARGRRAVEPRKDPLGIARADADSEYGGD
jgi:hypothetical protein